MLPSINPQAALSVMQQDNQFYIYINNTKAPVNQFYVPDVPDKLGSFFWCQVGQHVCNNNCRFPVNMVRDVFVGKMSTTFRNNVVARDARADFCFSICSSTFALDLEASSEDVVDMFIAGIEFLVSGDGKSMSHVPDEDMNDEVKEGEVQDMRLDTEQSSEREPVVVNTSEETVKTGCMVFGCKQNERALKLFKYNVAANAFELYADNVQSSRVSFEDQTDVFVGTEHEAFASWPQCRADRCLALVGTQDFIAVEFGSEQDAESWLGYISNQFQQTGTDVVSLLEDTTDSTPATTTGTTATADTAATNEDVEDVLAPQPAATVTSSSSSSKQRNRRYSVMPSNQNFESDVASVGISVLQDGRMRATLTVNDSALHLQGDVNELIELTNLHSLKRASSDRVVFTCRNKTIEVTLEPIQLNGVISMINANLRRLALTLQPSGTKYVVVAYDPALMTVNLQNLNEDDGDSLNVLRRGACMRRYFSTKGQANSTLLWVYLDTHRFFTGGDAKQGVLRYVPLVSVARVLGLERRGLSSEDLIHDLQQILHTQQQRRVCDVLAQAEELTVAVGAELGSNGAVPLKTLSDVYLGRTTASLLTLVDEADQLNCFTLLFRAEKDTVLSLRSINASTTQQWIDSIKELLNGKPEQQQSQQQQHTTNNNTDAISSTKTVTSNSVTDTSTTNAPPKRARERRLTVISANDTANKSVTKSAVSVSTTVNTTVNTATSFSHQANECPEKNRLLTGLCATVAGFQEDFNLSLHVTGTVLAAENYVSSKVTLRYTPEYAKHGCLYVSIDDPSFQHQEACLATSSFECIPLHTISDIVLGKADAVLKSVAQLKGCKSDQCLLIKSKRGCKLRLLFETGIDCKTTVVALQHIISSQGKNIKYDSQLGAAPRPILPTNIDDQQRTKHTTKPVSDPAATTATAAAATIAATTTTTNTNTTNTNATSATTTTTTTIASTTTTTTTTAATADTAVPTTTTTAPPSLSELTPTQALQIQTTPMKTTQVVSSCEVDDIVIWLEPHTKCLLFVEDGRPLAPILNSTTGGVSNGIYLDYLSDVFVGKAADITQEAIYNKLLQASEEYCLSFFASDPFTGNDISLHIVAKHLSSFHRWCQALSVILTQSGASLHSVE